MARSRKPSGDPGVLGALPQENAALEARTRYLLKEIGEDAGFLEQWIVHYLAELLERVDDQKVAPRTRSEARAEIARVLPALWEQRIAREALHVRQSSNYWLRRTDTLDDKAEQLLAPLIADPNSTANLPEIEMPYAFRALHTATELVTRFLLTTASAEQTKSEVTSEAVRRFLRQDEEVQGLQAALARIVPDFAVLDPTDPDAAKWLVYQTLLGLTQAQLTLLIRIAADPPSPKVRKKTGRKGRT